MPRRGPPSLYFLGLDLGQASEPSALAIVERSKELVFKDGCREWEDRFDAVHLERFPLGTSYPAIIAALKERLDRPELDNASGLALDATAVGWPVVKLFEKARLPADVTPITITTGQGPGAYRSVPKMELVSTVQALLQTERLKVVADLQHAETLKSELLSFKVRPTPVGADPLASWREGAHDDLVFAVALATWLRTDSASFLLDRQRIVSLLALRTDSASLRFVAAGALSHDPSDPFPILSRA